MTDADIQMIEAELEITLPQCYREWALTLPADPGFETLEEGVELLGPNWNWQYVFANPRYIIKLNQQFRMVGVDGNSWPRHFFCIGDDDCGFHFFDLNELKTLYSYNHEEHLFDSEDISNLDTFILEGFIQGPEEWRNL